MGFEHLYPVSAEHRGIEMMALTAAFPESVEPDAAPGRSKSRFAVPTF
jgi:hypothetical protein